MWERHHYSIFICFSSRPHHLHHHIPQCSKCLYTWVRADYITSILDFPELCLFPWPSTFFQVPVGNENQQVVQQQYQQQVMVPVSQSVQGPMPVYYSVITPTQQNSTRYVHMQTYIVLTVVTKRDNFINSDNRSRQSSRHSADVWQRLYLWKLLY